MKPRKVTSLDVAEQAGVSRSAVSRVLTPGASASAKTKRKVQRAADKLGYRPNILARSLITGKSKIIGFIVAYLDNQFYPDSLQKLSQRLQEEGYQILIFTVGNSPDQVSHTVQRLLDYQVDAIVAASVSMTTDLSQRCRSAGVPIVLYNRSQDDPHVSYVTSDNVSGGRLIAKHFAEVGVKRPSYIAGWRDASTQRDREIGFRKGLAEHGIKLFAHGFGDFNLDVAKAATREMFAKAETPAEIPDGVFVANDHMAFGVMDVLRYQLGLRVPEDVVVAGYDDVAISSWAAYDLTSLRQPANRMVDATVDAILLGIEDEHAPAIHKQISGPLMVRGSTTRRNK